MTWQSVFFSSNGRIGQKDFWIAALVLFLAGILSFVLHLLAFVAWAVLAYCWICILAKRLHDAGRSGWLVMLPFAVGVGAVAISAVIGSLGAIGAVIAGLNSQMDSVIWAMLWGSLGIIALLFSLAGLVKLVFLLWVGLSAGQPGDNRYGPASAPWIGAAAGSATSAP